MRPKNPYRHYKTTLDRGKNRSPNTVQMPCGACEAPLWITLGMKKGGAKVFFCDLVCRNKRQSFGSNPELKGGYLNKSQGYFYIRVDGKAVLMHRILMERKLARKLRSDEHVHHINGIRNDNRLENLAVVSNRNHPTEKLKYIHVLQARIRLLEKKLYGKRDC